MARTSSCCVMARPSSRRVPSTSRRYRIFSPSVILQSEISILQFAMRCKRKINCVVGQCFHGVLEYWRTRSQHYSGKALSHDAVYFSLATHCKLQYTYLGLQYDAWRENPISPGSGGN